MIEVYTSMDRLMLEAFRTTAEVGLYTSAYKLATFGLVPTSVLYAVFFPFLSSAFGDPAAMASRGKTYARSLFAFGAPIALAAPFLAGGALEFAYGAEFLPAEMAMMLLLANVGVMYLNMSVGIPLMAWDLQKPYMWTVVAGAVANVVLNVALIPSLGMEGAAAATVLSETVVFVGLVWLYRRAVGRLPFGSLPRALAAALVGHVLLGVAASAVAYSAAAWAFGVVDGPWLLALFRRQPPPDPGASA
jgi:O-antigen/teichoic acid export membrane protein